MGTTRDCAEANLAVLKVAEDWHDGDVDGELPVAVAEDRDTVTGSGWVKGPVTVANGALQAVRLWTSLATPFVPGMSYCKLRTLESARELAED